ncbi:MAG: flagellar motor protein MotB [bacterium]
MASGDDEAEGGGEGLEEEQVCKAGAPEWVVTFGDMMSLLLTFFILLLSFATMDVMRFKELAGTIKQGFGLEVKERIVVIDKRNDMVRLQPRVDMNARRIMEELRRKLDPNSRTKRTAKVTIEVFQSYKGVVVLFPADELFVPGTDRLRPEARPLLLIVADQLRAENRSRAEAEGREGRYELQVEARSAPGAPRAAQFSSVWSLTAAQAVAIAQFMRGEAGLVPGDVVAVGRGPAPPTQKPGSVGVAPVGSTVEFVFLSPLMRPKD